MSYPRDVDEISTAALRAELLRREEQWQKGLCHYCLRVLKSVPSCRMVFVHAGKEES